MIEIVEIRSLEKLREMSAEWDQLVLDADQPNIFGSWAWTDEWIRAFGVSNRLHCLAVYDDSKLVALAPLWLDRFSFFGIFNLRVLRLLGSKDVYSDHLDLLTAPKVRPEYISAIWDYLFELRSPRWDAFAYHDILSGSPILSQLSDLGERDDRSLQRQIVEMTICPYMRLPDSWEEVIASLSGNQRRALRVARRRLEEEGKLRFSVVTSESDVDSTFDMLVDLNRKSWEQRGESGSFISKQFESFHRSLAKRLIVQDQLLLTSLWLDDKCIGCFYGFVFERRVSFYIIGVDLDAVPRANVGRVLLGECIRESIERGCTEFDFLRGNEPYKYDWTNDFRRNISQSFYRRTLRSHLYLLHRFFANFTKEVAKSLLGKHWGRTKKMIRGR